MQRETSDFYSMSAEFYDLDYREKRYNEDLDFYVSESAASGGPVLELGCGTGRVSLAIAEAGIEVEGVDLSESMLQRLHSKLLEQPPQVRNRLSAQTGDLCSIRLHKTFPLVISPFRVVQHLIDRRQQRQWLRTVRRHLRSAGSLVFDVFQPDFELMFEMRERFLEIDYIHPQTSHRVRRWSQVDPMVETQTMRVHFNWCIEDAAGAPVRQRDGSVTLRWFTRAELENLLELEGFQVTDYWGTFDRQPFGVGSQNQIVKAKPSSPDHA